MEAYSENDQELLEMLLFIYQKDQSNILNRIIEKCLKYFKNVGEFILDPVNMNY